MARMSGPLSSGPCFRGPAVTWIHPRETKQLRSLRSSGDLVQQRPLTQTRVRRGRSAPQSALRDVTAEHIPKMKHKGSAHQISQRKAAPGIPLVQRRQVHAGNALPISVSNPPGKPWPGIGVVHQLTATFPPCARTWRREKTNSGSLPCSRAEWIAGQAAASCCSTNENGANRHAHH